MRSRADTVDGEPTHKAPDFVAIDEFIEVSDKDLSSFASNAMGIAAMVALAAALLLGLLISNGSTTKPDPLTGHTIYIAPSRGRAASYVSRHEQNLMTWDLGVAAGSVAILFWLRRNGWKPPTFGGDLVTGRRASSPHDPLALAKLMDDIAAGQADDKTEDSKSANPANLGRLGRALRARRFS